MISKRYTALLCITFSIVFGQVSTVFDGFGFFAGDKDKDKDGDKNKGGPFSLFVPPNETVRREEGLKRIHFSLLSRKNQSWINLKNHSNVPDDLWHDDKPLKLLIHSYSKDTLFSPGQILAKQNILQIGSAYGNKTQKSNIMLVDWTSIAVASEYEYEYVVRSTPSVGKVVADYLLNLVEEEYVSDMKSVHIIGYGVGAHVAAVAGKLIKKKDKENKLGRITGVDPAGVGFDDEKGEKPRNKSVSLDKLDARFVDIIHCSMGVAKNYQEAKYKGRFGSRITAGHVDFYPNGGVDQIGCEHVNKNLFAEKDCNTLMCPKFYEKSVVGFEYVGCKCADYEDYERGECNCTLKDEGLLMGEPCKRTAKGKHWLKIDGTEKKPDKPHKNKKAKKKDSKKVTTSATTKVPKKKKTTITPAPTDSSTTPVPTSSSTSTTSTTVSPSTTLSTTTAESTADTTTATPGDKVSKSVNNPDVTKKEKVKGSKKLVEIESEETEEEEEDDDEGEENPDDGEDDSKEV